jgi:serine/threonine protein kinase
MSYSAVDNSFKLDEVPTRFVPSPGDYVDQYKIEKFLGGGTYGDVYQVIDSQDKKYYALKILKLYDIPYPEAKETIGERFRREFICGQINSNYIVHSHKLGVKNGNPYLIMDFCAKGDLRAKVKEKLDFQFIDHYATDILMGLRDLHKEGIIHRDLKPDNVMLTDYNRAILADFGITGFINHSLRRQTRPDILGRVRDTFGTYAYIAPEQLIDSKKFKTTCPVTDIFSFGVMMYEMISGGYLPFGALDSDASLAEYIKDLNSGRIIPIEKYRNNVPEYWTRIINQSLRPNFNERFQRADDILPILGSHISNEPSIECQSSKFMGLKIMNGFQSGLLFSLTNLLASNRKAGLIRVGRLDEETKNQIPIDDSNCFISRRHATLEYHDNITQWIIRDGQWNSDSQCWHNSLNGTYVNSTRVDSEGLVLRIGDIITLGDTTLKVVPLNTNP